MVTELREEIEWTCDRNAVEVLADPVGQWLGLDDALANDCWAPSTARFGHHHPAVIPNLSVTK